MGLKYFLKEIVSNPVLSRHGKQIPFEVFGGDWGGIVLDESNPSSQELIEDLNKLREARTGGIIPSNEADYGRKKSEWPYQPSASQYETALRVFQSPQPSQNPGVAAAASPVPVPPTTPLPNPVIVENPSPAPVVPTTEPPKDGIKNFKPRVGRVGKKAAPVAT